MNALRSIALASIALATMSNSCESKNGTDPSPIDSSPVALTLKTGQQQVAGALTVKLVSITEGRCPRENCSNCYGGYATVQVDVLGALSATQRLTFRRLSCLGPDDLTLGASDSLRTSLQQVGSYRIGLINMTDFVQANKVDPTAYSVKLLLQKK